jgi:hypothetical protein
MSHESQESFRDTTDVESTGRQLQNAQSDLITLPPAGAAFPSPPRIATNSIERRDTDVEIETEIVPPGTVRFIGSSQIIQLLSPVTYL